MNDIIKRIIELLESRKIEQQVLADYLGIKKGNITEWKAGRTKSYTKYIDKIAEFFDVTTDYLLYGTETPTFDEKKAIDALVKTYSTDELLEISSLSRDEAKQIVDLVHDLISKR